MKKIMILGGGKNQLPIIYNAKRNGYQVILCDYLPDCPGKSIADKHYLVSTYDYDALYEIAVNEKVSGVVSNSEPVLHIVSKLTDSLNLPTVPLEIMERFLNKNKMRDWLSRKGINDIKYALCDNVESAIQEFINMNVPKAIIKPLDSSASRGVFTINSIDDIKVCFPECIGENRRGSAVLLEEYIEGTEFTVDGICIDGHHTTLAISKKKHYEDYKNVAYELFFSYDDDEFNYNELRKLNDMIVEAAELPFGMTHAEYKYHNGKYYLIEVAARGGGAYISTQIVPYLVDYDTVNLLIESSVGERINFDYGKISSSSKKRVAVLEFFDTPGKRQGIVKEIEGIDFLENNNKILKYGFEFKKGDLIKPAKNDAERIGYYIAVGDSQEQLKALMNEIEKKVVITFEE